MTTNYATHVSARSTPQTEPVPGKQMTANSEGGFVFAVTDWSRLDRFLVLGSEGGSYYASERKLTKENAEAVLRCLKEDGARVVSRVAEVSEAGRAPKNDPAVFALALCASFGDDVTRRMALANLSRVCRIGTHLFQFVSACNEMRGWSKTFQRGVADWYFSKDPGQLAHQLMKYQQRDGWSHRDVLRLCKPKQRKLGLDPVYSDLFYWATKGWESVGEQEHPDARLRQLWAFERAKKAETEQEIVRLITDYGLPRECVPTNWLNSVAVWGALLEKMPLTALVRNLGKMTSVGLIKPLSRWAGLIPTRLADPDELRRARMHPLTILVALKTYAQGRGDKGSLTWAPVPQVVDALDAAFYKAFDLVEPTNKRWFLALDVSGSMSSPIAGSPLSCCEAATALSLVTTKTEPWTFTGAFQTGIQAVPFGKCASLNDALKYTRGVNFGGTDCSLPMKYAAENKLDVDVFVVLTDSETYAGTPHPFQALRQYRQKSGIDAKLVVAGMVSNGFSIADPSDPGMLDVVGFSTDVPAVMADFVRGDL